MKGKISASTDGNISGEIEADAAEAVTFISKITPDFVKNFGGLLNDRVLLWRFKNQVSIVKRTKEIIGTSGLALKEVPLRILIPIIEKSSLEERQELKEKWSALLANATTGVVDINPSYAVMLSELSPVEIAILDKLYDESSQVGNYEERRKLQFNQSSIKQWLQIEAELADQIVDNFYRLNICRPPAGHGVAVGDHLFALSTTKIFELTTIGFNFIRACRYEI